MTDFPAPPCILCPRRYASRNKHEKWIVLHDTTQSKCIIFAITYINKFLNIYSGHLLYFRLFSGPGKIPEIYIHEIYIYISIAFPAAVRCYTIIWLNQSLPLIRSGISGGNYWNWLFELEIFGVTLRSAEGFIEFCLVIL